MEYINLRNKIGKFYSGGRIQKFDLGGKFASMSPVQQATLMEWANKLGINTGGAPLTDDQISSITSNARFKAFNPNFNSASTDISLINQQPMMPTDAEIDAMEAESPEDLQKLMDQSQQNLSNIMQEEGITSEQLAQKKQDLANRGLISEVTPQSNSTPGNVAPGANNAPDVGGGGLSADGSKRLGIAAKVGVGAMNVVDNLAMGDKNFGAQSQAIDSAVHGVSGALMSSGNPYAMIAGAAIEGANFLTKAGGRTVQGYDVNIENSGYGTLGHMESSSSRDWGAMIGLGGLFNRGAMERKLAKRNEQARMAMKAAEISDDIKFEQEARMNAVDNVLRNNQIALSGGVDLNLLGS